VCAVVYRGEIDKEREYSARLESRLDKALGALRDIYNTPPKLSEAQDQTQEWWVRLVDDIIGQAGNAIQSGGVETHERIGYCIEPECTERVELAGKLYCRAHAYTPLSE
jgi:hypothetical protein